MPLKVVILKTASAALSLAPCGSRRAWL